MKKAATISIRRLQKQDLHDFRRLRLEALQKAPTAFGSSYAEESKAPLAFFAKRLYAKDTQNFGAFAKDRLVGILGLLRDHRMKRAHGASLVGMYVSITRQRQGIGASLLDHAIAFARASGEIRYLKLSVTSGNKPARALYASRGFQSFGTEAEALFIGGRFLDEEHMALKIAPARKST